MTEPPGSASSAADDTATEQAGAGGPRVVDFEDLLAGSAGPAPVASMDTLAARPDAAASTVAGIDDVTDGAPGAAAELDDVASGVPGRLARVADLDDARRARRGAGRDGGSPRDRGARSARNSAGGSGGDRAARGARDSREGSGADRPARRARNNRTGSARDRGAGTAAVEPDARPTVIDDSAPAAAAPTAGRSRSSITRRGDGPDATSSLDADPEGTARAVCLRLLTDRARTKQELTQALRRRGVPDEAARTVLDRFDDVGLIDDGAFAEQWVRSRHAVRGLGRRALAVELRRKGVADDVAAEALTGIDADAEEQRARELVERKLRSLRTDTDEQRAAAGRKLVGMLARKGYGGGLAYRIVRDVLAARGAELDELASEPPADD